jgi:hypothetical protein
MPSEHEKSRVVIVNGRERTVEASVLSFAEVVALAFDPVPEGPNWVFTVTYRRGHGEKPEGSMTAGAEPVKVKEGMVFNVSATDKS